MATATVCDKCGKVLRYASDTKITIYIHPWGNQHYELCSECTKELQNWLNSKNKLRGDINK